MAVWHDSRVFRTRLTPLLNRFSVVKVDLMAVALLDNPEMFFFYFIFTLTATVAPVVSTGKLQNQLGELYFLNAIYSDLL